MKIVSSAAADIQNMLTGKRQTRNAKSLNQNRQSDWDSCNIICFGGLPVTLIGRMRRFFHAAHRSLQLAEVAQRFSRRRFCWRRNINAVRTEAGVWFQSSSLIPSRSSVNTAAD